jgi:hypothetical protein
VKSVVEILLSLPSARLSHHRQVSVARRQLESPDVVLGVAVQVPILWALHAALVAGQAGKIFACRPGLSHYRSNPWAAQIFEGKNIQLIVIIWLRIGFYTLTRVATGKQKPSFLEKIRAMTLLRRRKLIQRQSIHGKTRFLSHKYQWVATWVTLTIARE